MEKHSKKPILGIVTFSIGAIALAAGATFFIIKNNEKPAVQDAEYLVSIGEWAMQSDEENNIVWNFTEIGKGTLTTNNHIDDHDFKWSIEDGKLKIETEWLYDLYGEYGYELDQEQNTLDISKDDEKALFKPLSK